jgi:hypothetical protein
MNTRRKALTVALLLIAGFVCGVLSSSSLTPQPVQAQTADKQGQQGGQARWENYVLVGNSSLGDIQGRTNNLGDEGWEVTSVVREQETQRYIVFLKRPKR